MYISKKLNQFHASLVPSMPGKQLSSCLVTSESMSGHVRSLSSGRLGNSWKQLVAMTHYLIWKYFRYLNIYLLAIEKQNTCHFPIILTYHRECHPSHPLSSHLDMLLNSETIYSGFFSRQAITSALNLSRLRWQLIKPHPTYV